MSSSDLKNDFRFFKKRLLCDGKVYLSLPDCAEVFGVDIDNLRSVITDNSIVSIDGFGECITEADFNQLLDTRFMAMPVRHQLTRFETLDDKAGVLINMYPLKLLVAGDYFKSKATLMRLSVDDYIEKVDFPDELAKAKDEILRELSVSDKVKKYCDALRFAFSDIKCFLRDHGIRIQHLTTWNKGSIHIRSYYVGQGAFWSFDPDMTLIDYWSSAFELEDGTLRVPSDGYDESYFDLTKDVDRDFSQYSVIDNLIWCVQNINGVSDEFSDSVEYHYGGVRFDVDKIFLSKLLNPSCFKDVYYFDGLPVF